MQTNKNKYNLGIALSGGGAKGFAHLGALQALNEKGFYPDIMSGTSAGAFAGVLYADGYAPEEIMSFFKKKAFREFAEFAIPHGGFFKSERFSKFLKKHLRARTFENLKIPLLVVATDIEYGESHIFKSGPLIPAVVASCSVPIVFQPVKIDDHYYVDGGLLKNFPVSTIRRDCAKVIGINVSPIKKSEFKSSIKFIAERSFHYMSGSNTLIDCNLCDYLIELESLSQYSMFDLDHVEDIFETGYKLTMKTLEQRKESLVKDFPYIRF